MQSSFLPMPLNASRSTAAPGGDGLAYTLLVRFIRSNLLRGRFSESKGTLHTRYMVQPAFRWHRGATTARRHGLPLRATSSSPFFICRRRKSQGGGQDHVQPLPFIRAALPQRHRAPAPRAAPHLLSEGGQELGRLLRDVGVPVGRLLGDVGERRVGADGEALEGLGVGQRVDQDLRGGRVGGRRRRQGRVSAAHRRRARKRHMVTIPGWHSSARPSRCCAPRSASSSSPAGRTPAGSMRAVVRGVHNI